jgi:small nuclear ribonucleoprotein (snRNP)-like protein
VVPSYSFTRLKIAFNEYWSGNGPGFKPQFGFFVKIFDFIPPCRLTTREIMRRESFVAPFHLGKAIWAYVKYHRRRWHLAFAKRHLSAMSEFLNTPNSELDEQQIRLKEEFQISQGPLSVLQSSVRNHTQILISLRNNKKLLARVKAFDRHSNMVLENVKEVSGIQGSGALCWLDEKGAD